MPEKKLALPFSLCFIYMYVVPMMHFIKNGKAFHY